MLYRVYYDSVTGRNCRPEHRPDQNYTLANSQFPTWIVKEGVNLPTDDAGYWIVTNLGGGLFSVTVDTAARDADVSARQALKTRYRNALDTLGNVDLRELLIKIARALQHID